MMVKVRHLFIFSQPQLCATIPRLAPRHMSRQAHQTTQGHHSGTFPHSQCRAERAMPKPLQLQWHVQSHSRCLTYWPRHRPTHLPRPLHVQQCRHSLNLSHASPSHGTTTYGSQGKGGGQPSPTGFKGCHQKRPPPCHSSKYLQSR